ncbi:Uncharacterized protein Rs2_31134 [Raphanus sativus]|nr:Uncharacterized protein Rs2_31134 [Raphanus sativus]
MVIMIGHKRSLIIAYWTKMNDLVEMYTINRYKLCLLCLSNSEKQLQALKIQRPRSPCQGHSSNFIIIHKPRTCWGGVGLNKEKFFAEFLDPSTFFRTATASLSLSLFILVHWNIRDDFFIFKSPSDKF